MAVDSFFGQCYVNISRTYDFIYFRNTLRSIGQSSDRLSSACLIYHIYPGLFCSYQRRGIHLPVFSRRRSHDNLLHACHFCRNNIHQHGRRIDRLAPGYIDAYFRQCRNLLPQKRSIRLAVKPAVTPLFFVISPNVDQRLTDHLQQILIHILISFLDFLLRYPDRIRADLYLIKSGCIFKQCFIAFLFHRCHNISHSSFKFLITVRAPLQKIFQNIFSGLLSQFYDIHILVTLSFFYCPAYFQITVFSVYIRLDDAV